MRGKKNYADGGILDLGTPQTVPQPPTSNAPPNTYPFTSTSSSGTSGGNANTTNVSVGQVPVEQDTATYKRGGSVKTYAKGGKIDGCAQRGKTRGRMV